MRVREPAYLRAVANRDQLLAEAELVFHLVWRFDFGAPGFCAIDCGSSLDSRTLRSWMVALKDRLSEIALRRGTGSFGYLSLGRFDQQVTTKFHRDGAPERSLLMLGYEPSKVRSRLFLADHTRAAFDLGVTPQRFLRDFNPMSEKGEKALGGYVSEAPQPAEGHSRIVLVNNSSLPFDEGRANPLGVLHKAVIDTPDDSERRIINSTMLAGGESDKLGRELQEEFVATDAISPRVY